MDYFLLLAGLTLLMLGGKYLVRGSASLALLLNMPPLLIGVTVVAFGTSAPELLVSAKAALTGHQDIATGNVIGSNITNIGLVLSITAILIVIPVKVTTIKFDWPVMMFSGLLLLLFSLNGQIEFYEGLVFTILLVAFVFFSFKKAKNQQQVAADVPSGADKPVWIFVFILGGCIGLAIGADWLVRGASSLAEQFGISERVISISMVAVGTSLPELITSIIAVSKKETDISVGNIIGSNIFNTLAVLGISGLITNIPVNPEMLAFDIPAMLALSLLLFVFILPLKGGALNRWKGIVLLLCYIAYIYLLVK
ncbi:MAG: calcium/sodium antiporter [Bacteroidales bacterium]|nr:calcium/sodium antiporter [Bacteroidales bacterium]